VQASCSLQPYTREQDAPIPHKVETKQDIMVKAISDLPGFRSLIVPIVVAVATALLTLLFCLVPNFP
jgi:hypothetical protein